MSQPGIIFEQVEHDSFHVPGSGDQIQSIFGTVDAQNGTTVIPFDNTVPLVAEGSNIGTGIITRSHNTSNVLIQFSLTIDASLNNTPVVVAVFRGDKCIAASVATVANAGNPVTFSMTLVDDTGTGGSPNVPLELSYSGRVGVAATGTWYVNSTSSGNDLGSVLPTTFVLTELL